MPQLDDIVQKITVEGGSELSSTLGEIGHAGVEAFEKISIAAKAAGVSIGIATGGLTILAGVLVTALFASNKFVESQIETAQSLEALGKQLGITASEVEGLNAAFGTVGIKNAQVVGRAMQQVAKDISKAWTEIPHKIAEGKIAIEEALLGVASAQTQLSQSMTTAKFAGDEWANKLTANALAVEEAYKKVARASQDAARQARNDALGISGAKLDLEEAEAKLSESRGGFGLSDYRKKQIEQERLDLDVQSKKGSLQDKIQDSGRHVEDQASAQKHDALDLSNALLKQEKDLESMRDALDSNRQAVEKNTAAKEKAELGLSDTNLKDLGQIQGKIASGQSTQGSTGKEIADAIKANIIAQGDIKPGEVLKFFNEEVKQLNAAIANGSVAASQKGEVQQGFGEHLRGQYQAQAQNLSPETIEKIVALAKDPEHDKQIHALVESGNERAEDVVRRQKADIQGAYALIPVADAVDKGLTKIAESLSASVLQLSNEFKTLSATLEKDLAVITGKQTPAEGHASGGHIRGPGGPTADRIPAMLSDGEFVMRTAAVNKFGVGFMHALNNGMLQGFASGGYAGPAGPAYSGAGAHGSEHSVVNLTIDGNRFSGLRAPIDVAQKMTKYAVGQQTAATGRRPSWVG